MAQISGRAIRGVLRYVKEWDSAHGIAAVLDGLTPVSRAAFQAPIRSQTWYAYGVYSELLAAVEAGLRRGDSAVMHQLGASMLRNDAASILKILKVFSSVEGLVTRGFGAWGALLWSRHCDTGRVLQVHSEVGTATMGLEGFRDIASRHCRLISGYLEEMGRTVGATSIRVEHLRCVHRGDSRCEFQGTWGEL